MARVDDHRMMPRHPLPLSGATMAGGTVIAAVVRWYAWLVARTTLYTRFVLGVTAAICLALLVFGAGEAWLSHGVNVRIQQVESQNARLRQDIAATLGQAEWAESPTAIEDEARKMGYARPGEQPVVIVTAQPTSTPLPAPAPAPRPSDSLTSKLTGRARQTWGLVFPFPIPFGG